MLSDTNTVKDVKTKMLNGYSDYGFADDKTYKNFIKSAADDTYLEIFLPVLGTNLYNTVKDKDKVDLSEVESYIYWAEVHMICSDTLNNLGKKQGQTISGDGASFSSEGYSQSVTNPGKLGYYDVSIGHMNKAKKYLALAGYPLSNRMKRGGDFHSVDSYPNTEYLPGT